MNERNNAIRLKRVSRKDLEDLGYLVIDNYSGYTKYKVGDTVSVAPLFLKNFLPKIEGIIPKDMIATITEILSYSNLPSNSGSIQTLITLSYNDMIFSVDGSYV